MTGSTAAAAPLLEADGVAVRIGAKEILSSISFTVRPGEYLAVIGPNGAGKSTLLKTLNRIVERYDGVVRIAGHDIRTRTMKEHARLAAYVPQAEGRDLPLPARDFVMMGRYPHLSPFTLVTEEDHAKADAAMKATDTLALADRSLNTLSGGERQRVFIAAALCQDAPLLLLDEPTAFLDPKHQDEIHDTIARVNSDLGVTVICVTHDINAAIRPPVTAVLALRGGTTVYCGTPHGLLAGDVLRIVYGKTFAVGAHPVSGVPVVFP